jgi:hypothetical protein
MNLKDWKLRDWFLFVVLLIIFLIVLILLGNLIGISRETAYWGYFVDVVLPIVFSGAIVEYIRRKRSEIKIIKNRNL